MCWRGVECKNDIIMYPLINEINEAVSYFMTRGAGFWLNIIYSNARKIHHRMVNLLSGILRLNENEQN